MEDGIIYVGFVIFYINKRRETIRMNSNFIQNTPYDREEQKQFDFNLDSLTRVYTESILNEALNPSFFPNISDRGVN